MRWRQKKTQSGSKNVRDTKTAAVEEAVNAGEETVSDATETMIIAIVEANTVNARGTNIAVGEAMMNEEIDVAANGSDRIEKGAEERGTGTIPHRC